VRHVHVVYVGSFLAVHLDAHEVLVHHGGYGAVFKRFVLHHVAPVAGGVAYADDEQLVFVRRFGQRLVSPRVPVYRVAGVLKQVG